MDALGFPSDAAKTFIDALKLIFDNESASSRFSDLLQQYEKTKDCPYGQMLTNAVEIGKDLGIHEYTASMLLFLCMAEKLRSRYAENGFGEDIYLNSMADLSYKLEECRLIYGINGSFVASWFRGFFDMTRFALGRLQFEMTETTDEYVIGGVTIPSGSKAINIHIPRTGTRLDHKEVLGSYHLAAEFFANEFDSSPVLFTCHTWLLDPWNMTVLSPESNLSAFYKDFKIVKSGNYGDYGEIWRLFDCLYTGDPRGLPRDSSLRRAYAERVERGEPVSWGLGLFLYDGGSIIND